MAIRQTDDRFWIDMIPVPGSSSRMVAIHLRTNPHANMIGIYHIPIPTIAHQTQLTEDQVRTAFRDLANIGYAFYDAKTEQVFIPSMARDNISATLTQFDKRHKYCQKLYASLSKSFVTDLFFDVYGASFHLQRRDDYTERSERDQPPTSSPLPSAPPEPSPPPGPEPPKQIKTGFNLEEALTRYPQQYWPRIHECLRCLALTRGTGKIAPSVVEKILNQWATLSPDRVICGIDRYLDNQCYADGKQENYLWAIMRKLTPADIGEPGKSNRAARGFSRSKTAGNKAILDAFFDGGPDHEPCMDV